MDAKAYLTALAEQADIRVNGSRPWDIIIHNENFFPRLLRNGTLGLGEAYMDGWWDCKAIDQMIAKALKATLDSSVSRNVRTMLHGFAIKCINLQTRNRAKQVAEKHYNLDSSFFKAMLDPYMQYSCAYWQETDDLEKAQLAKMDLICRKLGLQPGMKVLDIGCGWGGLAKYMAENYDVRVTGINIADEQIRFAREFTKDLAVDVQAKDYRTLEGQWDRIVSVGMFEHVGQRNYKVFFEVARRCLAPDGLFLLHTIGGNGGRNTGSDPWLEKYIFPNGVLPSAAGITSAIESVFILEDWHNFGACYDNTLLAWHENFNSAYSGGKLNCPERIYRMFTYYLMSCAGVSRTRNLQLWQLVLSPHGVSGGYEAVR